MIRSIVLTVFTFTSFYSECFFTLATSPTDASTCEGLSCAPKRGPLNFTSLVGHDYDKMQAPKINGAPVEVGIKISVLTIRSVNEDTLSYEIDIFLHQFWKDPRIKLPAGYPENRVVLDNKWRDSIWTPDTYFKNALSGHLNNIVHPYMYLVLYNDSTMFLAARISLKLSCNMDLVKFPHDEQDCKILIMSLHHTADVVVLKWKSFKITKSLYMSQFYVSDTSYGHNISRYGIGSFSSLYGRMRLSRRLGYFMINNYIPCILIVTMSFVSFWIPLQAYPARVTLCVTSLLTIVTQQYKNAVLSVSYIVALNIWMMGCIAFVFLSLLEYALAITIADYRHAKSQKYEDQVQQKTNNVIVDNGTSVPMVAETNEKPKKKKLEPAPVSISHTFIDRCSRILFPSAFALFCIIYMTVFGR